MKKLRNSNCKHPIGRIVLGIYVFFLLFLSCQAQDLEFVEISASLNGYIEGTAYNDAELVRSSFIPGARLYLDHKDSKLFLMTIEEYADYLSKNNPKSNNGRQTEIISIDRFEDIASVKLKVRIPDFNRQFIDLLLLKKLESGWKILSKTAASRTSDGTTKKALLVVSNRAFQGASILPAGNSFSEVVIAYHGYQEAGYHVDMVSPKGGEVPLSYINPSDSLQLSYLYDRDFMYALANTLKPLEVAAEEYRIIQFTGGSAPIFDIPDNQPIQKIAMDIYEENGGVIAAVCHGTSALVNLKLSNGKYLIEGKRINGVPDAHETKSLPHYEHYPFIIEKLLRERGGEFRNSEIRTPHMEVDGRLITGQNSLSSALVTKKSVEVAELPIPSK